MREVTKLMTAQIEKIEKGMDRKLQEKDQKIHELKQKVESNLTQTQREMDLNQDLEDLENMESELFKD